MSLVNDTPFINTDIMTMIMIIISGDVIALIAVYGVTMYRNRWIKITVSINALLWMSNDKQMMS